MRLVLLGLALSASVTTAQPAPFSFGGPQEDAGYAVDVGPDGAFAVGGFTYGGYDADPGPAEVLVPNGGRSDGFAAVYGSDRALRFAVPFGPPGPSAADEVFDVALGPSGELAVVGQVGELLDLDPGPDEEIIEAPGFAVYVFVAVYEPDGALRYGFTLPGLRFDRGAHVALDEDGALYLATTANAAVDLDPGAKEAVVEGVLSTPILASYTAGGDLRWGFGLDGAQCPVEGVDVAGGRVALACSLITGALDVDPGPAERTLDGDANVTWLAATYTSDEGALASAFLVGGSRSFGGVGDLALDAEGGVVLVGAIDQAADFDPGVGELVVGTGGEREAGVVAAYDADGAPRFVSPLGPMLPRAVDTDGDRVVYTGSLGGSFDADPGAGRVTVTPGAPFEATTVSLTSAGAFEWASSVAGPGAGDNGFDVALGLDGRAVVTGRFSDTVDADPGPGEVPLSSGSRFDYDVFVLAYGPDGRLAGRPTSGGATPPDIAALRVWPNPSAGGARVRWGGAAGPARVAVLDVLGREVAVLHEGPPRGALDLRLPALAPGVYTVRATGAGGAASTRVTVVR